MKPENRWIEDHQASLAQKDEEILRLARQLEESRSDLEETKRAFLEGSKGLADHERVEILMQMAGATAHELSQPLTALLGYTQILRDSSDCPASLKSLAEKILNVSDRIARTVDQIQRVHRYETIPYLDNRRIIRFDLTYRILLIEASEETLVSNMLFPFRDHFEITRVSHVEEARTALKQSGFDLGILCPDPGGQISLSDFASLPEEVHFPPTVLVSLTGEEVFNPSMLPTFFLDSISRKVLDEELLIRTLRSTLERSRLEWEVRQAQDRLHKIESRDELTGILGQEHILRVCEDEIRQAHVHGQTLSVCVLDVDNLTGLNQAYGHRTGNRILKGVADVFSEILRQKDLCGRYSGDEFLVLLNGIKPAKAARVIGRLQKAIGALQLHGEKGEEVQVTVCVGIAEASDPSESTAIVLERAEKALRAAKNQGPNQVRIG